MIKCVSGHPDENPTQLRWVRFTFEACKQLPKQKIIFIFLSFSWVCCHSWSHSLQRYLIMTWDKTANYYNNYFPPRIYITPVPKNVNIYMNIYFRYVKFVIDKNLCLASIQHTHFTEYILLKNQIYNLVIVYKLKN